MLLQVAEVITLIVVVLVLFVTVWQQYAILHRIEQKLSAALQHPNKKIHDAHDSNCKKADLEDAIG